MDMHSHEHTTILESLMVKLSEKISALHNGFSEAVNAADDNEGSDVNTAKYLIIVNGTFETNHKQ